MPQLFARVNQHRKEPYHCYVGSQFVKEAYDVGTVHFAPFYDADLLMPHAQFVFTHGGINTIMQSLSYGTPLILVPGSIHERRHNAREVAATQSGVFMETEAFTVDHLTRIILDGSRIQSLQEHARIVQSKIARSGGMQRAFEMMETQWLPAHDGAKLAKIRAHWSR